MTEKYFWFRFTEFVGGLAMLCLVACSSQKLVETTATNVPTITISPTETIFPTVIETETPRPTATPTITPIPTATKTSVPTNTLAPTATNTSTPEIIPGPEIPKFLLIPSGNPIAEWENVAVMAEAIAGQEQYGGYYFSVELPTEEVSQYYQQLLGKSGWRLTAVGAAEGGSIKLVFQNDSDQIEITIYNIEFSYEEPSWGFQAPASFVLIVK